MADVQAVAHLLGGRRVLGQAVGTTAELVNAITKGLPYASLDAVAGRIGLLTLGQRSAVLGVPERTLQRRADRGRLDAYESELTVRLARLTQLAESVLEVPEKAYRWLKEPNAALAGKRPLELIRTDVGTRMVEDVLLRIEHTVYG